MNAGAGLNDLHLILGNSNSSFSKQTKHFTLQKIETLFTRQCMLSEIISAFYFPAENALSESLDFYGGDMLGHSTKHNSAWAPERAFVSGASLHL